MADKKAGKVQESHSGEPKKGLKNNWIVRNLVGAAIFVAAILLVSNLLLGLVTRHGRTVTVPDLTNQTWSEAKYNAGKAGLRVEISDSVFVRRMKAGAVFSQNPFYRVDNIALSATVRTQERRNPVREIYMSAVGKRFEAE